MSPELEIEGIDLVERIVRFALALKNQRLAIRREIASPLRRPSKMSCLVFERNRASSLFSAASAFRRKEAKGKREKERLAKLSFMRFLAGASFYACPDFSANMERLSVRTRSSASRVNCGPMSS